MLRKDPRYLQAPPDVKMRLFLNSIACEFVHEAGNMSDKEVHPFPPFSLKLNLLVTLHSEVSLCI